jgi:hypothetical protein
LPEFFTGKGVEELFNGGLDPPVSDELAPVLQ